MALFGLVSEKKLKEAEQKIEELRKQVLPEYNTVEAINKQIEELQHQLHSLEIEKRKKELDLDTLTLSSKDMEEKIKELKKDYIELNEEVLYQSYSLYKPIYDFATSEEYKEELERIRIQQKGMIKNQEAVVCTVNWKVDGSEAKGKKVTNDNIKLILRCFNTDCENAIDRVKYSNIESMRARIIKSYDSLNKLAEGNKIFIRDLYRDLKLKELNLAVEYALKKQDEKEEQKRIRQEMREQAKLEKELEEARKNIDKEKKHYSNALDKLNSQLEGNLSEEQKNDLLEKKEEIESQLSNLQKALDDVDYREANQKAGYVYIISNIGAFGENVYKIGMTRRLDPMDRIDELGDASVPFNFDVHAMIFSEDAPKLEAALHKAFEDRKLNMINTRREFFRVTLDEIEAVVKANYDKTVEFIKIPPAEQYRQSLALLEETKKR
ncbi:MAG: DUF4041 domain-containing protein [Negativibacillus sp.]